MKLYSELNWYAFPLWVVSTLTQVYQELQSRKSNNYSRFVVFRMFEYYCFLLSCSLHYLLENDWFLFSDFLLAIIFFLTSAGVMYFYLTYIGEEIVPFSDQVFLIFFWITTHVLFILFVNGNYFIFETFPCYVFFDFFVVIAGIGRLKMWVSYGKLINNGKSGIFLSVVKILASGIWIGSLVVQASFFGFRFFVFNLGKTSIALLTFIGFVLTIIKILKNLYCRKVYHDSFLTKYYRNHQINNYRYQLL